MTGESILAARGGGGDRETPLGMMSISFNASECQIGLATCYCKVLEYSLLEQYLNSKVEMRMPSK